MHLSGAGRDECRPVAARLGAYVRGGPAKRDAAVVAVHLDQCVECRRVIAEFGDVNVALKGIVAPIVLGPAAVAYLASAAGKGSAVPGSRAGWAGSGARPRAGKPRRASRPWPSPAWPPRSWR